MTTLIKASQGDDTAFAEIVSTYNAKAAKIASIYVGNNSEDIVQDVWEKILNKRQLLAEVENFENWLFLVVRNTCFNYLKVEKRRQANVSLSLHDNISFAESDPYSNLLEMIVSKETTERVRALIESLPEMYSLPLIMSYAKGMKLAEISETLNLPLSTVKWRIRAAKLKIKQEYVKEVVR